MAEFLKNLLSFILFELSLIVIYSVIGGYPLMLLMGVFHYELSQSIPTIGYTTSVIIIALCRMVIWNLVKRDEDD